MMKLGYVALNNMIYPLRVKCNCGNTGKIDLPKGCIGVLMVFGDKESLFEFAGPNSSYEKIDIEAS